MGPLLPQTMELVYAAGDHPSVCERIRMSNVGIRRCFSLNFQQFHNAIFDRN